MGGNTTLAGQDALRRVGTSHEPSGGFRFHARQPLDVSPEALRMVRMAVKRAKEGDDDAFRYLYLQYSHNIYGYVRSIVRDEYLAEDVTQHVFAKLMTAITKYDDRGIPFFAWLLRLSRNVAIDHLRADRLLPCEDVISADAPAQDELDVAFTIRDALATLPEDQRQTVFLRHVVGLSPGEIAEMLGKTESSVHGLHHRGRRALQQELSRLRMAPTTRPRQRP